MGELLKTPRASLPYFPVSRSSMASICCCNTAIGLGKGKSSVPLSASRASSMDAGSVRSGVRAVSGCPSRC
jgi:hypothetical protein